MYYYGNFKFAFRKFRRANVDNKKLFKMQWDDLFVPKNFPPHSETIGLMNIDEDLKWCLGYLSVKYSKIVKESREKLALFLPKAIKQNCSNFDDLTKMNGFPYREYFTSYLPPHANLLPIYDSWTPFKDRLENAMKICSQDVEQRIKEMQKLGRQNMFVYLTLSEIDVYFATSMRTPEHFYNTSQIIRTLFKEDERLNKLNIRVFDPTSSFSHDRLDKGLIECLMVACSKVTLYNAQEVDTFGKDSEAALSLVMRHPVIVYVARLFETDFNEIYNIIDQAPKKDIDLFYDIFKTAYRGLYSKYNWILKDMDNELLELLKTPITHDRLIEMYIDKALPEALKTKKDSEILGELDYHGYLPTDVSGKSRPQLIDHLKDIIKKLEKRALVFLIGHPLSMLASPLDGVARGIIITRSVSQTNKTIYMLLNRELKYKIERNEYGWRLIEKETGSPIRIVALDRTLTSVFWDKFLSDTYAMQELLR